MMSKSEVASTWNNMSNLIVCPHPKIVLKTHLLKTSEESKLYHSNSANSSNFLNCTNDNVILFFLLVLLPTNICFT